MKKIVLTLWVLLVLMFVTSCVDSPKDQEQGNQNIYVKENKRVMPEYDDIVFQKRLFYEGIQYQDGFLFPDSKGKRMIIKRFDGSGKVLWTTSYKCKDDTFGIDDILLTHDGGFLYSVSSCDDYNSILIKCNNLGKIIWKRAYKKCYDNVLEDIFETETGDILTIGMRMRTKKNGEEVSDIYLSKLNGNGNLIGEKTYPGSDFDMLCNTQYIERIGLVSLILARQGKGVFHPAPKNKEEYVIAHFDASLNLTWQKHFNNEGDFYTDNHLIYFAEKNNLLCLNLSGEIIWKKDQGGEYTMMETTIGDFTVLQKEKSLVLLDDHGEVRQKYPFSLGRVEKIICYEDGFLIESAIMKNLPQPEYINSAWYSTILYYSKYDYSGNLIYQKEFDVTPEGWKRCNSSKTLLM